MAAIGHCNALEKLDLAACFELKSLPESEFGFQLSVVLTLCFAGVWQLPLTKLDVSECKKLDVKATLDMIVQSFPGLTELRLASLQMETLPEGVIPKCVA